MVDAVREATIVLRALPCKFHARLVRHALGSSCLLLTQTVQQATTVRAVLRLPRRQTMHSKEATGAHLVSTVL